MEKLDIEKLKTKSGHQLNNYIKKFKGSSFTPELQSYHHFRDNYLSREYSIKHKIKLLEKKIINANDSITRNAAQEDCKKMQQDLIWIMEGFFEFSESEKINPPSRDFFKSDFFTI